MATIGENQAQHPWSAFPQEIRQILKFFWTRAKKSGTQSIESRAEFWPSHVAKVTRTNVENQLEEAADHLEYQSKTKSFNMEGTMISITNRGQVGMK